VLASFFLPDVAWRNRRRGSAVIFVEAGIMGRSAGERRRP